MKIVDVEAWLFHFPLETPFHPSWVPGYTSTQNSAVIYRLKTDDGIEGIAGGVAFADEAKGPVNLLRAYLIGLDVDDTDEIYGRLSTASRVLGIRAWFVETAFWDIRGKAAGKSIAELLGTKAKAKSIQPYASTGELRSPEEAADHAVSVVEQGFRALKIRTRHPDIQRDIAMVAAVRGAVGDDITLMCDANQAWRVDTFAKGPVWDLGRALNTADAMEDHGVEWLEEPLDMFDLEGYRELAKNTKVAIAAGELHGEPSLVRLLMEAEGVDVVQPDLVYTGGVTGAWGLARESMQRGLRFSPHTWSHGLGLAANLHLAVAAENANWLEFPFDPPGWVPDARDAMLTEPILPNENGVLEIPNLPGLGVEIDEEKLKTYGTLI